MYLYTTQGFSHSRITSTISISPMKFCYMIGFPHQNDPKNLDLPCKMDLDFLTIISEGNLTKEIQYHG